MVAEAPATMGFKGPIRATGIEESRLEAHIPEALLRVDSIAPHF